MTLTEQPGKRNGALALMRAVREARILPPLRKLIALMLVTYADPNGSNIRPSLQTVASLSGLDVRSVRRHVRALEADGVLVQTRPAKQHYPAEYRLVRAALRPDTRVRPDTPPDTSPNALRAPRADSGAPRADSDDTQTGLTSPPTCSYLKNRKPEGAAFASPAGGQAHAALPKKRSRTGWSKDRLLKAIATLETNLADRIGTAKERKTLSAILGDHRAELAEIMENAAPSAATTTGTLASASSARYVGNGRETWRRASA